MIRISKQQARRLAIACQGLDGALAWAEGKEGVAQAINHLGYVQIDTIAVVQRAHHHTLWVRRPDYEPDMLWELQAEDRRIFEYWAPAASFVPMNHYRYYLPAMRAHAERPRTKKWLAEHADLVEHVLGRIREEGGLASADFEAPEGFKRGTWWSRKPAKQALEHLFSMGKLMVSARRGFQRVYDLPERVLPPDVDRSEPVAEERRLFRLRRALRTQGVITVRGWRWGRQETRDALVDLAESLVERGELARIEVEGLEDEAHYGAPEFFAGCSEAALAETPPLQILSPFDNLIIDRDRLLSLFGFDFSLECYLPAEKRRYGYFALPILWGDRFVGRVDCKADRKAEILLVRQLSMELDADMNGPFIAALAARLCAFAAFNGCSEVSVEGTEPHMIVDPLRVEIARLWELDPSKGDPDAH
ncbi:MAG: YcaQ family DNA glycosylase [Anaerolineae bacterium]|nr:YcaQ family DNA glycosylase [Anaerolineae bacterium]